MKIPTNKPDAADPAIALLFQIESRWRGAADPDRYMRVFHELRRRLCSSMHALKNLPHRFFIATLMLCLGCTCLANPLILAHRYYISREDMRALLSSSYADLEGTFQIQKAPRAKYHNNSAPLMIEVPLYVPVGYTLSCTNLVGFWKICGPLKPHGYDG
jgi:hypothetical protein